MLLDIVRRARTGDYGSASSLLTRSIIAMQAEFTKGNISPVVLARTTMLLDELLKAQQRADWVAFADILEYTFIDFWRKNFTAS